MKLALTFILFLVPLICPAAPQEAPDRTRGEGPFDRLVLRGVTIVNGEGAEEI